MCGRGVTMAILAECNWCHRKQGNKNKKCGCGNNLDKAKAAKKVNYWINYRHHGKQVRKKIGNSLSEAQAAEGKIKALKYENSAILDAMGSEKMTFNELFDWFLTLTSVMALVSYRRIKACLDNCRAVFGTYLLNQVKLIDLENYQILRKEQGRAPATIDMELKYAKTAVKKAFDNDKIDAGPLKAFNNIKKVLKGHSNARDRKLSFAEYKDLLDVSPSHLKALLIIAFNTGMRTGEIVNLKREYVNMVTGIITLPASVTKEGRKKRIPINHHVKTILTQSVIQIHGYVVNYKGDKLKEGSSIRKSFIQACKLAGIPYGTKVDNGITPRDIRTTFKTNMLKAGVGKTLRDVILGHSLKGMDAYYIKPDDESLREAMEKYTGWLDIQLNELNELNNLEKVNEMSGS